MFVRSFDKQVIGAYLRDPGIGEGYVCKTPSVSENVVEL